MKSGVAKATILLGLIVIAGGALTACSKKSGGDPLVIGSGKDAGRMDRKFGKGFGKAFNADPNAEPHNVDENDVAPVSFTTEPEPID